MILLLKHRPDNGGQTEDDNQLDVIDSIRKEIVQSGSGTLNAATFDNIMERINKVCRTHFFCCDIVNRIN